jgi:hypothetical protein
MDEVFIIASDYCARCRGHNPAELFADQVWALHDHLKSENVQVLMWGDRLLNATQTGYGEWEASANGTDPAIDLVPKDIIICDWHYEWYWSYPSLAIFANKGFRVWPCTYEDPNAASRFSGLARQTCDPLVIGALSSTWNSVSAADLPSWPALLSTLQPWKQGF